MQDRRDIQTLESTSLAFSRGFTLIEMSIVLVVIGLIIGGILAGQDMIETAKLRKTVSDLEQYSAAMNTFRVKYNCIAGDCDSAAALGLGSNGDGNGRIYMYPTSMSVGNNVFSAYSESVNLWYHLSKAGMIPGTYRGYDGFTQLVSLDGYVPRTETGSNSYISAITADDISANPSSYKVFGNSWFITSATLGASLTAPQAYWIDKKLDDGSPSTGIVEVNTLYWVPGPGASCLTNQGVYDVKGQWVNFQLNLQETSPNPGQIGCTLAIGKAW